MRKLDRSTEAGSRNAAIDRSEDAQTLGGTVIHIRTANGLDESAPDMHAWRFHAVLQRNVRHDVARRSLGGNGDMSHPLPLRPSPLLMKHVHGFERLRKLHLACQKLLDLLAVHERAVLKNH